MLKHVDIYITHTVKGFVADSARYAYALTYRGEPKYGYGEIRERITQNSLLLMVMKEALKRMLYTCEITIYIDSQYISNAFHNGWAGTWKNNGYKKADGGKIVDASGWEELLEECGRHVVEVVCSRHHEFTKDLETIISRRGNVEGL